MKIELNREDVLGSGGFGSVYSGRFEGRDVAVKRVLLSSVNPNEEDALRKLDHPNVIKLFHCESDADFRYYALELCVASLDQVFLEEGDPKKYKGPFPRHIQVFLQLASGLEHIHLQKLTHRDIKPQNVLISTTSTGKMVEVTIKWADFGLSKPVTDGDTYTISYIKGTANWFAPEIIRILRQGKECRGTVKSDVFVLALLFGYLFLNGEHLYGSNNKEIEDNILIRNPINEIKIDGKLREFYVEELLNKMLQDEPSKRITSTEVVNQLNSIQKRLSGKEKELRNLCQYYGQLDLKAKVYDFIRLGIDVNAKDNKGWNALHFLCRFNSSSNLVETVQILVQSGIDVNAKDNDGWNALHLLCRYNSSSNLVETVRILVRSGIDVNAKDNDGWNALHILCRFNSSSNLVETVQILVQFGIDVNANNDGWNALHLLCRYNSSSNLVETVRILVQSGIDVKEKINDGRDALYCYLMNPALYSHTKELVVVIIKLLHGFDLD